MRVLISGSSGTVGSALLKFLRASGHQTVPLRRTGTAGDGELLIDNLTPETLSGVDVVIHLAGYNLAEKRWSPKIKDLIYSSRVRTTNTLAKALKQSTSSPKLFICASAVGYYGDRGSELLTEDSSPGVGYLANLCEDWEGAAEEAARPGLRIIQMRTGMVLTRSAGALQKMLLPFRLGLGGKIGSGRQFISWIELRDLCSAIKHCIENETVSGPVNFVSPHPVSNREFSRCLAQELRRPALIPLPAAAAKLLIGEMAVELLLSSTRAIPEKLTASGFSFRCPTIEQAFAEIFRLRA